MLLLDLNFSPPLTQEEENGIIPGGGDHQVEAQVGMDVDVNAPVVAAGTHSRIIFSSFVILVHSEATCNHVRG